MTIQKLKDLKIGKLICYLICYLAIVSPGYAVFTKLGMAGMPFLKIGVGRATGMADAFVAVANDASATYWNPAGLALLKNREVLINHIDWILETRHEFLAGVFPTKLGVLGISVTSVNLGDFEETTIDKYQGTGRTFSASDLCAGVSFARMFTDRFAFGTSVKVIQERVWEISASTVAFDFGTYYNTGWQNVRLAMAIANFGPDTRFSGRQLDFTVKTRDDWTWPWTWQPIPASYMTEKFPLPITFRFGIANDFTLTGKDKLTFACDLTHFNDVNEKINFGLEYSIMNISLRGGYILNTDTQYAEDILWRTGISFGAGFVVKPVEYLVFRVDYGYRDVGRLGISHRITLGVSY
ncbi:MAG: PorV/PorQ family protein [candidate division WOR-3 bacterium]